MPGAPTRSLPARLGRSFYGRPSPQVAPDLLGRVLVRPLPGEGLLMARIVEVEAYQEDDPASHSHRGRTVRTEVMFGQPGHLYVYFSYGNHWCMNVVTGAEGEGSAVLLRAAEPLDGLAWMREARGVERARDLCSGPGKLAQAFGVTKDMNGLDLVGGSDLYLARGDPVPRERIGAGPRVGISVATERPWRFVDASSAFLSRRSRHPSPGSGGARRARR